MYVALIMYVAFYTKITRKLSENEMQIIDNIANEYATNLKSNRAMLGYWDINVMHYTVAITLKNYVCCLVIVVILM